MTRLKRSTSFTVFFSSAEHAQGELLRYCNVLHPSYVWTSETSVTSVRQLFVCVHSKGHKFDRIYMKLCQDINLYKIKVKFETESKT